MVNSMPCRSCGKPIVFLKTGNKDFGGNDKTMPVDADTVEEFEEKFNPKIHRPHWSTCPRAQEWRKPAPKRIRGKLI